YVLARRVSAGNAACECAEPLEAGGQECPPHWPAEQAHNVSPHRKVGVYRPTDQVRRGAPAQPRPRKIVSALRASGILSIANPHLTVGANLSTALRALAQVSADGPRLFWQALGAGVHMDSV